MAKKAAKKKPVQPRTDGCFKVPRITQRDYEIYEMCKGQGQRQKDVAAKFRITQPRVSTIVNRVAQYLSTNCPSGYFELPREKRLVTLFRTHRMRLEHAFEEAMAQMQAHPVLMDYVPFTPQTGRKLEVLARLQPRLLAAMHGSAYEGDGAAALRAVTPVMERLLGLQPVSQ